MQILAIGQPYCPEDDPWPEGCHYNYDSSGHWLHYLYSSPCKIEVESIQSGQAQFGLYIQDPVIFLLHKFGAMPWNDAPYSWWMVSREHRRIHELANEEHAFLRIVLIDTATGLVAALRALTFSTEFTKRLHLEILRQSQSPWDLPTHDQVIKSIYSRFSTNDLVQQAHIFCKGGD